MKRILFTLLSMSSVRFRAPRLRALVVFVMVLLTVIPGLPVGSMAVRSSDDAKQLERFAAPSDESAVRHRLAQARDRLPLSFEPNRGQTDPNVVFIARGDGYTAFLTPDSCTLTLGKRCSTGFDEDASERSSPASHDSRRAAVRIKLESANLHPEIFGEEPLSARSNYFIGNDRSKWITNLETYRRVRSREVYPGVDMVYYGDRKRLEYDFIVSPGHSSNSIELSLEGAERARVDDDGSLVIETAAGRLIQRAPIIYQESDGFKERIDGGYVMKAENRVAFEVGDYDTTRALVIDPVLVFATYFGGDERGSINETGDVAAGVAMDQSGNVYIVGTTDSTDLPIASPGATTPFEEEMGRDVCALDGNTVACGDVFVSKFTRGGESLVYSTYLGSQFNDEAFGIAVDSNGRAYVTGGTDPRGIGFLRSVWPTTSNSYQNHNNFAGFGA